LAGLEGIKMAYAIKISAYAKIDRRNIVKYLAQYSVNAPLRFKHELKKYIEIITQTPSIFATFEYAPKYRHVVIFGSYVMFYAVDETSKTVFIYRVLHGSQDIEHIL
jgi:plasmid stabilization system protein ParE